jgi:hypothetical protein
MGIATERAAKAGAAGGGPIPAGTVRGRASDPQIATISCWFAAHRWWSAGFAAPLRVTNHDKIGIAKLFCLSFCIEKMAI